jgi:branched-subunit amino acid transport protein
MLGVRTAYTRHLLPDVRLRQLVTPTLLPITLGAGAALAVRFVLWGGHRSLLQAIVELALFAGLYTVVAARRERDLLAELLGSMRRSRTGVSASA